MAIETTATLGDRFLKGFYASLMEVQNQADEAYALAMPSALGVEKNTYTSLFKEKVSNNAQDVAVSKTGVGLLELTNEGEDYKEDNRVAGYQTIFQYPEFTKRLTVTRREREDRLMDAKLEEAFDLMVGGKQTMNKHAFSIFNYAFTAQASLPAYLTFYGDGVPMCSTVHPIKASTTSTTTQSNASTTSIALTETNLEVARQALRRQLDDKGLPMSIGSGSVILIVPDSLEKLACIITGSDKRSGTANNDMNVYYGGVVTVISSKWLNAQNGGSDTAWFLVDAMKSPLRFVTRRSLAVEAPWIDQKNKNVVTDISARWIVGNVDFRGVWGSKGDLSAYAS
jgi:hypothetical protein